MYLIKLKTMTRNTWGIYKKCQEQQEQSFGLSMTTLFEVHGEALTKQNRVDTCYQHLNVSRCLSGYKNQTELLCEQEA